MKQTTHGINVFEEIDNSMSFREWRDKIAAATNQIDNPTSNMEVINDLFTKYVEVMKTSDGEIKGALSKEIDEIQQKLAGIIEHDTNGDTCIGDGSKIIFRNSPNVEMNGGILDVVGVKVSDHYKTNNYKVSEMTISGEPHLRVSFIGKK